MVNFAKICKRGTGLIKTLLNPILFAFVRVVITKDPMILSQIVSGQYKETLEWILSRFHRKT